MEGFATGFTPTQATKPGFAVENEKFRVTFDGVSLLEYLSDEFTGTFNQGDVQRCEEHHQPRFRDLLRLAACAGASVGGGL